MSIFSKKKVATGSTKSSPAMPNPPTSTSTTTGTNVGNFTKKRHFGRLSKKALLLCIAVVLVAGAGAVWQKYHNKPKPAKQKESTANCIGNSCSGVVNKPYLEAAVNGIITNNSQALFAAVENIQKIPNYQKDVDYLYVVVYYNIIIGDPEKAQSTFNTLKEVHKRQQYSKLTSTVAPNETEIQNTIDALVKTAEQAKSNIRYGQEPKQ